MKRIYTACLAASLAIAVGAAVADRNIPIDTASYAVGAGAEVTTIVDGTPPITVTAIPGGGGTMTIYTTTSTRAAISAGTATWIAWPAGAVAVNTANSLLGAVTAIKCAAAVAVGVCEIAR